MIIPDNVEFLPYSLFPIKFYFKGNNYPNGEKSLINNVIAILQLS